MPRNRREYGLSPEARVWGINKKFGSIYRKKAAEILQTSTDKSDKVLGAILFLSRPGSLDDLASNVDLANESPQKLLDAATVKDERT